MKKFKSFIRNNLNKLGFFRKWQINTLNYEIIYIILFALQNKEIKIIQIGANDGIDLLNMFNNDYHKKISYVGIEPQEIPFNQLKKNYENFDSFKFIQECVGKKGSTNFFYLNENYEEYCKNNNLKFSNAGNSLSKENLSKRLINIKLDPEIYISKYEIQVNPLYDILKKNNLDCEQYKNIDLLQIDAEGYDDEVIYNSNLEFFRPKYINFEYHNLNKIKLENLIKFLNHKSYECLIYEKSDCLAVLRENV
jgi:FkbM family methyltransferase